MRISDWSSDVCSSDLIYLERAYSYRALGYTYLAIDDFERAGAMGAGWAAAHNGMGMVRREKGDLTGAMADFDTAIHHDAGFAAAWSNRGLCHPDRYEDMQAAVDFTRALELGDEQAVTLFNRAAAYARLTRPAEANADLPRPAAYPVGRRSGR